MGELIGIIILLAFYYVLAHIDEWKFDRRLSPPGMETDWAAMSSDLARGMSKRDVMRKSNAGGYDKPKSK